MKKQVRLGVVCLARETFDYKAAEELYKGLLEDLSRLEAVTLCAVTELVISVEDAEKAAKTLYMQAVDGIAVISGTFHLGHLGLEIKKIVDKPLLLWGLNELPYNGGKIRLNSVCGVNLNASNLTKSGYTDFVYTIGDKIDTEWLDAIRMRAALKESKIGILGYRAHGFFNVGVDELALYKQFGCLVDHYELGDLFNEPVDEVWAAKYEKKLLSVFNTKAVSDDKVKKVAELAAKLKSFVETKRLKALAIRCWPEFAALYNIAPCAAMSLLQSEDYILACEGDIDCAITMICHQAAGAETPFMADLSQVNLDNNFALMWHCGVAPCNLCDGICEPTLDTYFAGGKGVTAGFVMKPGVVTIARLDSINGKYRLFQEKGKAQNMEKQLTGTYAKVVFDKSMKEVLDRVVYSGVAHHVSMVYGDYTGAMKKFVKLLKIEEV
ncbi:MAG: fucose isomerase [Clostridia bacterium]|nr:fucose isomerase [Clostridia bacterium]